LGKGGLVNAYEVGSRLGLRPETHGYSQKNLLASYVHLHFGSNPELASGFVSLMKGQRKIA
jgi:cobyrinic acid a,c-diamide synthase